MRVVFDAVEPNERILYAEALAGHDVVFLDSPLRASPEGVRDAEILSVFVTSPITRDIIELAPNLRSVVARSMGFDHIDLEAAQERGITVQYVPAYGSRTVAEFSFALILALSRKVHDAYDRLRSDGTASIRDFEGFDLAGKTIGVIGTGKIGKNMARIARGFDMTVLLCDTMPDEAFAKGIECAYCPLEQLIGESDIVSLHVPLMPQTKHMINEPVLAGFKRGSYLINTARGGVVDTQALVQALKRGILAGAGLDVLEGERSLLDESELLGEKHRDLREFKELVAAHALVDMPNVIVTPHIAFNTREAKREILNVTTQNILSFAVGAPQNVIKTA